MACIVSPTLLIQVTPRRQKPDYDIEYMKCRQNNHPRATPMVETVLCVTYGTLTLQDVSSRS